MLLPHLHPNPPIEGEGIAVVVLEAVTYIQYSDMPGKWPAAYMQRNEYVTGRKKGATGHWLSRLRLWKTGGVVQARQQK